MSGWSIEVAKLACARHRAGGGRPRCWPTSLSTLVACLKKCLKKNISQDFLTRKLLACWLCWLLSAFLPVSAFFLQLFHLLTPFLSGIVPADLTTSECYYGLLLGVFESNCSQIILRHLSLHWSPPPKQPIPMKNGLTPTCFGLPWKSGCSRLCLEVQPAVLPNEKRLPISFAICKISSMPLKFWSKFNQSRSHSLSAPKVIFSKLSFICWVWRVWSIV